MEKRTPHHDLRAIQHEVARIGAKAFTKTALDGGRALGMPKTRHCLHCDAANGMAHFADRTLNVEYKTLTREVPGLSGWECQVCGEVEFDDDGAVRYAEAGDQLIEDAQGAVAAEMKRVRKKIGFTQAAAVRLLSGGGHNAFSRYERADVPPPQALVVLLSLLDRHPYLVEEVKELNGEVKVAHLVAAMEQKRKQEKGLG